MEIQHIKKEIKMGVGSLKIQRNLTLWFAMLAVAATMMAFIVLPSVSADGQLDVPSNFSLTNDGWTAVDIEWDDVANATGYSWTVEELYGGEIVGQGKAESSMVAVNNLQRGTSHIFRVTATGDGYDDSAEGVFHFAMPGEVDVTTYLETPRGFDRSERYLSGAKLTAMDFTWNSVPNATQYKWSVRSRYGDNDMGSGMVSASAVSVGDLTRGTAYILEVTAMADGHYDSDPPAVVHFSTAGEAY